LARVFLTMATGRITRGRVLAHRRLRGVLAGMKHMTRCEKCASLFFYLT
jgi:hypothetical protein